MEENVKMIVLDMQSMDSNYCQVLGADKTLVPVVLTIYW